MKNVMKKILVTLSLIVACITAFAQGNKFEYVVSDPKIQEEIVRQIAAEYSKGDKMVGAAYETMLREGFNAYFNHKKTKATVFEIDTVASLNRTILQKDKELKALSKENQQKVLADSAKAWADRHAALMSSKNSELRACADTIGDLKKQVATLISDNAAANNELASLRQSASIVKNITNQLAEKQQTLNTAYSECNNGSLEYITDLDGKRKAIEGYTDFLKLLDQPVPDQQQRQIDVINSTCDAAEFYNKARAELKQKYDQKSVDNLIKKSATIKSAGLNSQKATELVAVTELLKNEGNAIKNLRNIITYELMPEGSIPDRDSATDLVNIINKRVNAFVSDPNSTTNGYNAAYTYLNQQLDRLRKEILNWNKYQKESEFKALLNQISDSLGDQVK